MSQKKYIDEPFFNSSFFKGEFFKQPYFTENKFFEKNKTIKKRKKRKVKKMKRYIPAIIIMMLLSGCASSYFLKPATQNMRGEPMPTVKTIDETEHIFTVDPIEWNDAPIKWNMKNKKKIYYADNLF